MDIDFYKKILNWCERRLGMNTSYLSKPLLSHVLQKRQKAVSLLDPAQYFLFFESNASEQQSFIDEIVVPETWFFRDPATFNFLQSQIYQFPLASNTFQVLSLPCSTGEEPYSIAMLLQECGLNKKNYCIDAMDISSKAIEVARKGEYQKKSFRPFSTYYRFEKYFNVQEGSIYTLKPIIRNSVNFFVQNGLDELSWDEKKYDVIFCKNLLVYLQPKARKKLLNHLKELLTEDGIIFVSPFEVHDLHSLGFEMYSSVASAFRKKKQQKPLTEISKQEIKHLASQHVPDSSNSFERAFHLADQGQFEDALALCIHIINKEGVSAQGFYLMGLIQHATGHEGRAEDYFLKTIYLQPSHVEALFYLSLLAERQGKKESAKLYRDRIHRLKKD